MEGCIFICRLYIWLRMVGLCGVVILIWWSWVIMFLSNGRRFFGFIGLCLRFMVGMNIFGVMIYRESGWEKLWNIGSGCVKGILFICLIGSLMYCWFFCFWKWWICWWKYFVMFCFFIVCWVMGEFLFVCLISGLSC